MIYMHKEAKHHHSKHYNARPHSAKPHSAKQKNPYAVFLRGFVGTVCALLILLAAITYVMDPYYHYHAPWFGMKAVLYEKEYQVVGTLRHFDYDAVLVGSSVVENNDNSWYDAAFGVKTVKAVRSYGGVADLCWYLGEAYRAQAEAGKPIRRVFFNLDPASLLQESETTFVSTGCPMYLYDDNPLNDVKYLWNKTVLFEKIPYEAAQSFSAGYQESLSYNWAEGKNFSREGALSQYYRKAEIAPMQAEDAYDEQVNGNIALLRAQIEAHPETEFVFFVPPYSQLWWDDAERSGMTDVYLHAEKLALSALLGYDNVQVYDFQNENDVTWNLDYYMDTVHFAPEINFRILQWIAQGKAQVTKENIDAVFDKTEALCKEGQKEVIAPLEEQGLFR